MMGVEAIYISALLIGLLGGPVCWHLWRYCNCTYDWFINQKRNDGRRFFTYQLSYNIGRILTYTITGTLLGSIGVVSEYYGFGMQVRKILTLTAASVMIFLGLYLTGWWETAIIKIENIGSILWRSIEPLAKYIIPISLHKSCIDCWYSLGMFNVWAGLFSAIFGNVCK